MELESVFNELNYYQEIIRKADEDKRSIGQEIERLEQLMKLSASPTSDLLQFTGSPVNKGRLAVETREHDGDYSVAISKRPTSSLKAAREIYRAAKRKAEEEKELPSCSNLVYQSPPKNPEKVKGATPKKQESSSQPVLVIPKNKEKGKESEKIESKRAEPITSKNKGMGESRKRKMENKEAGSPNEPKKMKENPKVQKSEKEKGGNSKEDSKPTQPFPKKVAQEKKLGLEVEIKKTKEHFPIQKVSLPKSPSVAQQKKLSDELLSPSHSVSQSGEDSRRNCPRSPPLKPKIPKHFPDLEVSPSHLSSNLNSHVSAIKMTSPPPRFHQSIDRVLKTENSTQSKRNRMNSVTNETQKTIESVEIGSIHHSETHSRQSENMARLNRPSDSRGGSISTNKKRNSVRETETIQSVEVEEYSGRKSTNSESRNQNIDKYAEGSWKYSTRNMRKLERPKSGSEAKRDTRSLGIDENTLRSIEMEEVNEDIEFNQNQEGLIGDFSDDEHRPVIDSVENQEILKFQQRVFIGSGKMDQENESENGELEITKKEQLGSRNEEKRQDGSNSNYLGSDKSQEYPPDQLIPSEKFLCESTIKEKTREDFMELENSPMTKQMGPLKLGKPFNPPSLDPFSFNHPMHHESSKQKANHETPTAKKYNKILGRFQQFLAHQELL